MNTLERQMREMEKQMAIMGYGGGFPSPGPPVEHKERVYLDPHTYQVRTERTPIPDSINCSSQIEQKPKPNKLLLLENP